ncbi:MAG: dihydrolipoyl dehydrogenase [SAR86 cluster bacterium]|nr:dihydrolipoyl dehydrogenase [SAR86 cluster bacterium]
MSDHYDVIIVGSGPGGYVAAIRSAQLGLNVLCIEKCGSEETAILGGTCLNVGCIPSKALLDSSYHFRNASSDFSIHGIELENLKMNIESMMSRKDKIVSGLTSGVAGLFKLNKVNTLMGEAILQDSNKVLINLKDGSVKEVFGDKIIIATGSKPIDLPGLNIDQEIILNSTGALRLKKVPGNLGVIGAGAIGLELGSVWSRLGSNVVILEALEEFLPMADTQIASEAKKILEGQGLEILLGSKVETAIIENNKVNLSYVNANEKKSIILDNLIVAVGRKPSSEKVLGPDLGLEIDERGFIKVNEFCETNLNGVYAIGDVVRGPMLAHKASEEGVMVAEILAGDGGEINYGRIPSVIYTHPEIAWVGLTSQEAEASGIDISSGVFPFQASGRALAADETQGFVKVITDKKDDSILGVHVIGPSAADIVQQGLISMEFDSTAEDLGLVMFSHPTFSEALHEAVLASRGNAIHIGNRRR